MVIKEIMTRKKIFKQKSEIHHHHHHRQKSFCSGRNNIKGAVVCEFGITISGTTYRLREKIMCHHGAHGMAADIFRTGVTAAIAEKACHWCNRAGY